jgi:hypothetical protein
MADAVRLIFQYEGEDLSLVSRQRVAMTVPPSEPLDVNLEERSGFWLEVRDKAGNALHRQLMHDPIRHDVEVFSDDPEQSVARVPVEHPSGVFSVVLPAPEDADHVALIGTPMEDRPALARAREIYRFSLRDGDEGDAGG